MDNERITQFRKEKYEKVEWSHHEQVFRRKYEYKSKKLKNHLVPFSVAVEVKFRRSIFGPFLDCFNWLQEQDKYLNSNKLDILKWDIQEMSEEERKNFEEDNSISQDMLELLIEGVRTRDRIDWNFIYDNVVYLRINDFHITGLDEELANFRKLRVLILGGNWIKTVPCRFLPPNLEILELCGNEITNVKRLWKKPPETLLHVGLGRNKLVDKCFRRLNKTSFHTLRSLDLSDNDIYNLLDVLEPLQNLNSLTALQLEGNPCAVCVGYHRAVLNALPNLIYLDNAKVLKCDRKNTKCKDEHLTQAALMFTCHRIMGLQAPPKLKGLVQTLHFEISLPLLEEIPLDEPEELEEIQEIEIPAKESKAVGPASGGKAPSPYDAADEYAVEERNKIKNTSFKTERVPWAKVIQFPEDAVVAESPEGNLTAIRDTFQSSVNVKLVYLQIEPPPKPKKPDKKAPGAEQEQPEEPKEKILKKVTLANFFCDLHNVNWSDKTVDFYWAAHSQCETNAIPVEGSLRAINYVEGKGKPPAKKGDVGVPKVPSKEFIPKIFTIQVGFGLKRL